MYGLYIYIGVLYIHIALRNDRAAVDVAILSSLEVTQLKSPPTIVSTEQLLGAIALESRFHK